MKKIDELLTKVGNYIFYDGIDFDFIKNYKGNDMIVVYVDEWNKALNMLNRENKINTLIGEKTLSVNSILDNNLYISIYQTNGYLDAVHDTIKSKIERQSGQYQIPKNGFGIKNINY